MGADPIATATSIAAHLAGQNLHAFIIRKELISSSHTIDEICRYITADSLGYLSETGLITSVGLNNTNFCKACFAGDYPVAFPKPVDMPQMGLFEEEQK